MTDLKPTCSVKGCLGRNAICGYIKCGSDECAAVEHTTCKFSSTYNSHLTRADIPEALVAELQQEALERALGSMADPDKNGSRFSMGYRMARKHLSKILNGLREQKR